MCCAITPASAPTTAGTLYSCRTMSPIPRTHTATKNKITSSDFGAPAPGETSRGPMTDTVALRRFASLIPAASHFTH